MSETVDLKTSNSPIITLQDKAVAKVKELMALEPDADQIFVRVAVQPGGCAGMQYAFYFDSEDKEDDYIMDCDGVELRVPHSSIPLIQGTTIAWVDSLQGAGFKFDNPNAQQGCACGDSFC